MHPNYDRIVLYPAIRSGKPIIRGTRINVQDILDDLAAGMSSAEIIVDFPDLQEEDIRASLA